MIVNVVKEANDSKMSLSLQLGKLHSYTNSFKFSFLLIRSKIMMTLCWWTTDTAYSEGRWRWSRQNYFLTKGIEARKQRSHTRKQRWHGGISLQTDIFPWTSRHSSEYRQKHDNSDKMHPASSLSVGSQLSMPLSRLWSSRGFLAMPKLSIIITTPLALSTTMSGFNDYFFVGSCNLLCLETQCQLPSISTTGTTQEIFHILVKCWHIFREGCSKF